MNHRYEHDQHSVAAHKINTNNPYLNTLIREEAGFIRPSEGRGPRPTALGKHAIDLFCRGIKPTTIKRLSFSFLSFLLSVSIFCFCFCFFAFIYLFFKAFLSPRNNFLERCASENIFEKHPCNDIDHMMSLQKQRHRVFSLHILQVVFVFESAKIIQRCTLPSEGRE